MDEGEEIHLSSILLDEVQNILEERSKAYGWVGRNFFTIASLWQAYLNRRADADGGGPDLKPSDVAVMMALVKIARLGETPDHLDSVKDAVGYMALMADVRDLK